MIPALARGTDDTEVDEPLESFDAMTHESELDGESAAVNAGENIS